MLLIWMGDEIKALRRKPEDDLDSLEDIDSDTDNNTDQPELLDTEPLSKELLDSNSNSHK